MNDTFPVKVLFDENQVLHWDSLIHLYNDWYLQYIRTLPSNNDTTSTDHQHQYNDLRDDPNYPRLIVRFEDMLLYAPYILQQIASCVGTTVPSNFKYQVGEAKSHGMCFRLYIIIYNGFFLYALNCMHVCVYLCASCLWVLLFLLLMCIFHRYDLKKHQVLIRHLYKLSLKVRIEQVGYVV